MQINDSRHASGNPTLLPARSLETQLRIANSVSAIATCLARGQNIDADLTAVLEEAGRLVDADRAYLFQFRDHRHRMDNTHEWCAEGVSPQISNLQGLSAATFTWFVAKVDQGEVFEIHDVADLPPEAEAERSLLAEQNIKSLLVIPLGNTPESGGFVGFDNVRQAGGWHSVDVELLRVVSQLIGDALEREQSRQALESSLKCQVAILESIPDMAWLKDAKSRFIHVNQRFAESCGSKASELVGKSDYDLWPPELAERYLRDDVDVMRTGSGKRVEEPLVLKDTTERLIETIKTPVFDSDGQVIGTTGIARDITERKQAELAVRESEARYRRLVESLPAIVYRYSKGSGAHYWSPQVEEILGFAQHALQSQPFLWHDAIHPDDLSAVDNAVEAFEAGDNIELNYRIRDAHGNWHWFHDRSIGRLEVDGSLVMEGVAFDVTDRKRAEQALRVSEEKYRLLIEHQTDMVVKVDQQGRFLFASRSYCEAVGKAEHEILGEAFSPLAPVSDGATTPCAAETLQQPPHECYLEQRALTRDGWRWFAWAAKGVIDNFGEIIAIVAVGRDISERKAAKEALAQAKEKALTTLHSIGDAVITTDARGRVEYLNPMAETLTGWSNTEATGRLLEDVFQLVDAETGQTAENSVARCLTESRTITLPRHASLVSQTSELRAIEDSAAPIRDSSGRVTGAVLVFRDITERRRLHNQLAYAARHDSLTGLANRTEFAHRLDHAVAAFLQNGTPNVLCYLDLDQFKVVNDAAGHTAGDEMLKQVAALLSTRIRSRDTLARLGGDEFGLLLENCTLDNAVGIGENLISTLADYRLSWGSRQFAVGVSIGLVAFTMDATERAVLTSRADFACLAAKDMGRNRVCTYQTSDTAPMHRRREIIRAAELREALQQNRFVLYAQPITRVDDPYGKPWRHEVLVRLRTRDNQLLQPGAFIPAAERFGLIADLDRWVIKTALREFAAFGEKHGRGGISINISGASLVDEDLADLVRSELASSGVAPAQVCFEIAETAAVNRLSQAMRFIDALRDLDCGFALDDFGSGLASFNYLKDLPVDCLKVDGSFVRDMATDPVDQATVKAITDISQVLGIQTVAEQVEDSTTVEAAVASGVAFLQGFAVGKPIPLSEIQPH